MKLLKKIYFHILEAFHLDIRSLAIMRIILGLAILYDLIYSSHLLHMFFSDEGFLPRVQFFQSIGKSWNHSLLFFSGHPHFVTAFFIVFGILALMFVLGFYTKFVTIALWVFLISIHNRNGSGLNGGDDLIRVTMLILCFLPLNQAFSIDRAIGRVKHLKQNKHLSFWGLTLLVQISVMYIASAHFKNHDIWRKEYSALYYALHLDAFTRPAGYLMRGFPGFLKFLTFVTIWTEMFLPYLMLIPIFSKRLIYFRYIPILFFVFFHMGIDFLMNVGIFPYYAMAIWIGLMPGHFWDYLTQKFHTEKRKNLTIYYDGDCGFCRKLVYIIKEFFLISKTKVYPSILNPNIDNVLKTQNTWVVKDETNQLHTKFDGIITVIQYSPIISWLSPLFTTKFIKNLGDYLYTFVANNRKFFSKFTTFLSFKKHQQIDSKSNLFLDALALLWIMCLLHWPMADLKIKPWYGLNWTWQTNRYLNSYQHWGLFSPYPKRNNVWIQIIGNLSDKTKVNLARFNFEVNDNWPKRLNTLYYNKMWRKFILRLEKSSKYRTYISKYHCKNWNYRHVRLNKHLLKSVDIIMHDELNYLNYRRGKRRRRLLQREVCY